MQTDQSSSQPEIDLLHFLKQPARLISKGIKYYFLKLRVNLLLFFFILGLAVAGAALLCFTTKPAYETEAIFVSHLIPANICTDMLNNLNSPYLSKAKELKIGDQAASAIQNIQAKKLETFNTRRTYDSLLYFNNDSMLNTFQIKMLVRDFDHIDTIQQALIQYLELSPFSMNRTSARREALMSMRANLIKKLESMDSVQLLVNNSLQFKRDYANGDPIDPMEGYKAVLYYNKQKIAIDQELTIMDNIELIKPFVKYEKHNYPNYLWLVLQVISGGLLLALILTPVMGKKPVSI